MIATITRALVLMSTALRTYGREPNADMARAWEIALRDRGIAEEEIVPTTRWYLANASEAPTPAEFADRAKALHEANHALLGEPYVDDDGVELMRLRWVERGAYLESLPEPKSEPEGDMPWPEFAPRRMP